MNSPVNCTRVCEHVWRLSTSTSGWTAWESFPRQSSAWALWQMETTAALWAPSPRPCAPTKRASLPSQSVYYTIRTVQLMPALKQLKLQSACMYTPLSDLIFPPRQPVLLLALLHSSVSSSSCGSTLFKPCHSLFVPATAWKPALLLLLQPQSPSTLAVTCSGVVALPCK